MTKIVMSDYVGDIYTWAKFYPNTITGFPLIYAKLLMKATRLLCYFQAASNAWDAELQTIVTDVRGVCLSFCLSVYPLICLSRRLN